MSIRGILLISALSVPYPAFADFSGAYGGIGLGTVQGEVGFLGNDDEFEFNNGTAVTIFGGYNVQNGNLIYGGEFVYNNNSEFFIEGGFGDDDEIDSIIDLRGRAGYALNDVMLYGAVGYSFGDLISSDDLFPLSGLSLGAGLEYKIDGGFIVGADYTLRRLEGEEDGPSVVDAASNVSTFAIRAGYSF